MKISAVSYTNSKPFIKGLTQSDLISEIVISLDNPAVCAQKLLKGAADIGLVPVAILPQLKNYHIISDYCISATNKVQSVMLYSDVPLKQIENIVLDYQSRTSIALTKVLAHHYWNIQPQWENANPGFENHISGAKAGVVIGDRTFDLNGKYKYEYDLSEQWFNYTQQPFVFACWVSLSKLDNVFLSKFNLALAQGLLMKEEVATESYTDKAKQTMLFDYLTHSIEYNFTEEKKKALDLFLNLLKNTANI